MEKGNSCYSYEGYAFCSYDCATNYIMSEVDLIELVVGEDDRL